MALRIPELRAQERLRAVRVRLLDLDQQAELRRLALDRALLEQLRVVDDRRAPVDAERVGDAGDDEEQRDVRVLEDVAVRVGEPVARPVGQEQRPLVEHLHEPGRIAARRDVAAAVGARGRQAEERRQLDELARQLVQPVGDLRLDDVRRLAERRAEGVLGGDHHEEPTAEKIRHARPRREVSRRCPTRATWRAPTAAPARGRARAARTGSRGGTGAGRRDRPSCVEIAHGRPRS